MNIENLRLSNDTKKLIKTLQLRLELHEGQQFKIHKDFNQIIDLLKAAAISKRVEIRSAYSEFVGSLDEEKLSFFKVLGAVNDSAIKKATKNLASEKSTSLEAQDLKRQQSESHSDEVKYDKNGRKLKKTVYRGQVRWV